MLTYKNIITFVFFFLVFTAASNAQLEKVIVEKWYVSDSLDATDTIGGYLEPGSTTYRIYVDLLPGSKIKKIFGDSLHPLIISSTAQFFNNKADGLSFGKDFSKSRLQENTVALDSWLTLGQVTRTSSKTYFGIPKNQDSDGSFIGGANNDGGSAVVPGGLITNSVTDCGIPVTTSDGNDTMTSLPSSWFDYGIIDQVSGNDTTIFGSFNTSNQFISVNSLLRNSGTAGKNPDSNQVLIAQLTTKGDISFELNIEVEETDTGGILRTIKYYAKSDSLGPNDRISPSLSYPSVCGCMDAHYLEYNQSIGCHNQNSCHTLIVFGCIDTMACNYNSDANYNVPELCCYPGRCNNRDIGVVCPDYGVAKKSTKNFSMFPNPAKESVTLIGYADDVAAVNYSVYDLCGREIRNIDCGVLSGNFNLNVDLSNISAGLYNIKLTIGSEIIITKLIVEK